MTAGVCTLERMVDGLTFSLSVPCVRCDACGEELTSHEAGERFELAIAAKLAAGGRRTGPALRFMRKALGLRAAELAQLIGVAAETFSRWETGEREPDAQSFALVGFLAQSKLEGHSDRAIEMLRAIREPVPMGPAPVKLAS